MEMLVDEKLIEMCYPSLVHLVVYIGGYGGSRCGGF